MGNNVDGSAEGNSRRLRSLWRVALQIRPFLAYDAGYDVFYGPIGESTEPRANLNTPCQSGIRMLTVWLKCLDSKDEFAR